MTGMRKEPLWGNPVQRDGVVCGWGDWGFLYAPRRKDWSWRFACLPVTVHMDRQRWAWSALPLSGGAV